MTSPLRLPHLEDLHDARIQQGHAPLLDHLRHVARDARCKSYVDLFGACASLSVNRDIAMQAASDVLMRCLSQALGRRPILFRAGEPETSFDEDWLLALARSLQTGDTASCTFLLHSRVPKHAHRNLVFLLGNVADNFPRI
ncbi:hypothetical protein [Roseovarius atlanticus]|uniref:hypothetical protein n=1 Tax=Roseovarius atlanticus TaxID=1641875 RepID=UPI0007098C0E|nr:hypothetical protein [Roseovarius atlanticus]